MIRFRLLTTLESLAKRHIRDRTAPQSQKKDRHTWQIHGDNPGLKEQVISLHNLYLFPEVVLEKTRSIPMEAGSTRKLAQPALFWVNAK